MATWYVLFREDVPLVAKEGSYLFAYLSEQADKQVGPFSTYAEAVAVSSRGL